MWVILWPMITVSQHRCSISAEGRVIDEHDNKPLPFAELLWLSTGNGTVADEEGRWQFQDLCEGNHQLVVHHVGCQPDTLVISLQSDTVFDLFLEHHAELLNVLTIEAKKPHRDIRSSVQLGAMQMAKNPGGSLADLLAQASGVQSLSSGGNISKPVINGMHGNRVVVMSDHTKLQGQQWGGEHAPELDPFGFNSIEVVKGAAALRYGPEAIAGAIIARTGDFSENRKLNGWAQLAGASNGRRGALAAKLQGALVPNLPLFFSVQGSATRSGDLSAPKYFLDNTGKSDLSGKAALEWKRKKYGVRVYYSQLNTELGILSYAHIGNLSDLELVLQRQKPISPSETFGYEIESPRQHVLHEITSAEAWWKPMIEGKLEVQVSRQYNLRQEFDNNVFLDGDEPALHYELTTLQWNTNYEHRFSERYKMELGTVIENRANTYEGRFFIPNYRYMQWGAYSIHHLYFKKWEFEAGLRADFADMQAYMYRSGEFYTPERKFSGVSTHAGASREFKRFSWLVNAATGWRPPSVNELYSAGLHHGASSIEFGNESLLEERVISLNTTLVSDTLNAGKVLFITRISAFAYFIQDYIYAAPTGEPMLTIRGAFPTFNQMAEDAFFRGTDFSLTAIPYRRVELDMSGEIVRANRIGDFQPMIYIPADHFAIAASYLFWERRSKMTLTFGADVVLKQWRVPQRVDFAPPPDGYVLFQAGVNGLLPFNDKVLVYSLVVENLANTPYRSYLNRLRYYAVEPGRNISFSLRIPI